MLADELIVSGNMPAVCEGVKMILWKKVTRDIIMFVSFLHSQGLEDFACHTCSTRTNE